VAVPVWQPEVVVGDDMARRLVRAQFPVVDTSKVEQLGFGWDNTAFLIGGFVFRFPRRTIAVELIEREMSVLPAIAALLPTQIPVPIFRGVPDDEYPWPFAGYEMLYGHVASSFELDDSQLAELAAPLGAFLRALHAIDPAGPIGDRLPGDTIGRLDHARRFPLATERLAELESAGQLHDVEPFLEFLGANPPGRCALPRIVHGDMYARHLLLDQDKHLCGVIDWGDVHVGDPALDLAIALTMLPKASRAAFVAAYGEVAEQTWNRATYRAMYHSIMVACYGQTTGDVEMLRIGLDGLERLR
jgi:aminoglycoside phosphotransferase (APT) family kinase protein